jgi:hypothetical protein
MWQADLASELSRARPSDRKSVLAGYARITGYSLQQLYRIAAEHGFSSGRKRRADRGVLRSGLADGQIEWVAALIATSARDKKGPILEVQDALEIAFDNGVIPRGQVSVATMARLLRERQISADALRRERPHTEMRSLHPNHVHVIDASVCIQYYLRNGKTALMRERDFYKNKPQNYEKAKTRILRYLLCDHFSGAIFLDYFDTTGETKENLFRFMTSAWAHKGDERFPFRGVPSLILWDRASANIAKAIEALLGRLDVGLPDGMPYNKMRQGAVETMQNIVERRFESKLAFEPAWSVEQLREWARDWQTWYNATQNHTRHGMTRTACWMLIKPEQLRELPPEDILRDLFAEPEKECTVDGTYRISFRGKEYGLKLIKGLFRGAKVKAVLKPFKWPVIDVIHNEQAYEVHPVERLSPMQGGFSVNAAIIGREYKSQPETPTQKARKRFNNMAYGKDGLDERGEPKKGAVPFAGITVHGIHAEKVGNLAFIEKAGTPIQVDRSVSEDRRIGIMEFLKRLRAEAGPISRQLNAELRARFGDSISEREAEEVIREFSRGGTSSKGGAPEERRREAL